MGTMEEIRIACIELAIKSNGAYSYNDGNTEISKKGVDAEKVIEDAQKFYVFIMHMD